MTRVFAARESDPAERRVSMTPETASKLSAAGLDVVVQRDAGTRAGLDDAQYVEAGASIGEAADVSDADIVVRLTPPSIAEVEALREGTLLLSFVAPHRNHDVVRALAARRISTLGMELVPRISRAQSIDALSSQANLAGYRAVVVAAYELDKYFPLFMTAAGTIRPATVVVLGAGVAGLQAVATAKRLGAIVKVSDIREAAKAEVASLGASFIDVPEAEDLTGEGGYAKEAGEDFLTRQRAALTEAISGANAVITTAQIPMRPAPELVTREMVEAMPKGSVVIDLAAADGGNCVLTDVSGTVEHSGVRIIPGHDFASQMPSEASAMYARNIVAFLDLVVTEGELTLDLDDEVVAGALLTHDGAVTSERVVSMLDGGTS
ncbi:MAG: Re/Si-specific NAD(P)(+) transhydrogenase subunit alpha [Nitriliruptoraceae bacterium]